MTAVNDVIVTDGNHRVNPNNRTGLVEFKPERIGHVPAIIDGDVGRQIPCNVRAIEYRHNRIGCIVSCIGRTISSTSIVWWCGRTYVEACIVLSNHVSVHIEEFRTETVCSVCACCEEKRLYAFIQIKCINGVIP